MKQTRPDHLTTAELADVAEAGEAGDASPHSPAAPLPGCCVGWLCADATLARLLVDYRGSRNGPQGARAAIKLDRETIARAVESRQGVLLQFEDGRFDLPIVVGLVEPPTSLVEELLQAPPAARSVPANASPSESPSASPTSHRTEARVDGRRVVLEGTEEVVLKCGEASITLKKDGKVILKGAYIETRSTGLNRIKGASVKIN